MLMIMVLSIIIIDFYSNIFIIYLVIQIIINITIDLTVCYCVISFVVWSFESVGRSISLKSFLPIFYYYLCFIDNTKNFIKSLQLE